MNADGPHRRRLPPLIATLARDLRRARPRARRTIESFSSTLSTTQAGGHPDLERPSGSPNPGVEEAARNVVFDAPEGIFGNPRAIDRVHLARLRAQPVPADSQAGLITVHANYEGDPNYLLGTAPLYDIDPGGGPDRLLRLHRPDPQHPDHDPGHGAHRRPTTGCASRSPNITQLTPLAEAPDLTIWGFPAERSPRRRALPERLARRTRRLPGRRRHGLHRRRRPRRRFPVHPLTDNPTICTGEPLADQLDVADLPGPAATRRTRRRSYPPIDRLRERDLQAASSTRRRRPTRPTRPPASTSTSAAQQSSSGAPTRRRSSGRRSSPSPRA